MLLACLTPLLLVYRVLTTATARELPLVDARHALPAQERRREDQRQLRSARTAWRAKLVTPLDRHARIVRRAITPLQRAARLALGAKRAQLVPWVLQYATSVPLAPRRTITLTGTMIIMLTIFLAASGVTLQRTTPSLAALATNFPPVTCLPTV